MAWGVGTYTVRSKLNMSGWGRGSGPRPSTPVQLGQSPFLNRMTDRQTITTENITFPLLPSRAGNDNNNHMKIRTISNQKLSRSVDLCCLFRFINHLPPFLFLSSSHIGWIPSCKNRKLSSSLLYLYNTIPVSNIREFH